MTNNQKFGKYVKSFDLKTHAIELKLVHSIKVAQNCRNIAESIFGQSSELVDLAYNIGLLHDISRFEQWKKHQTFIDRESFDHGDYSVHLLFDENLIKDFDIDEKWYPYIYIAIKNHNKLKINEQELTELCSSQKLDPELAKSLCFIIRDADKLDISRVFRANPNDMDLSPSAIKTGYTSEMMQSFKSCNLCDYKYRKTIVDFALGYLAFPFDFNFEKSNEIFAQTADDYISAVKTRYYHKLSSPEDQTVLIDSCNHLAKHFEKYKKLGE